MASVTWKQAMRSRITTPRKSTIILSLDDGTKSGKRKTRHLLSKCAVSLTKYLALRLSSVSPWLSPFSSMELKDVLLKINLQGAYPGSCCKFYLSDVIHSGLALLQVLASEWFSFCRFQNLSLDSAMVVSCKQVTRMQYACEPLLLYGILWEQYFISRGINWIPSMFAFPRGNAGRQIGERRYSWFK